MKIDPRLIARLEAQAKEAGQDPNALLAIALGVCPTCGQPMPTNGKASRVTAPMRKPHGTVKERIIEYLQGDKEHGAQSRCASQLGIKASYVNRIWRDYQKRGGNSPRGTDAE